MGSVVDEVWLRYLSGPCVEFGWYVHVAVDVVQVVVPYDAVHFCWICLPCAPFEIKHCPIVNGEVSEGHVLLPFGWTADLSVEGVVGLSAIDGIGEIWIDLGKNWRIHPVVAFELENRFGDIRWRWWFGWKRGSRFFDHGGGCTRQLPTGWRGYGRRTDWYLRS